MPDPTPISSRFRWKSLWYVPGYYIALSTFWAGGWLFNVWAARKLRSEATPDAARFRRRLQGLLQGYVGILQRFFGMRVEYCDWPADWEAQVAGCILAANHPCLLDAPLLLARSPNFLCLYKGALERSLVSAQTATAVGYLSNRDGIDTVREAVAELEGGATLLLFPEGTRSRNGTLGPLEAGGALIALRARAPVQTVIITTSTPLLTKDRSNFLPPRLPLTIWMRWGERLVPQVQENARTFNARLESSLQNGLTANSPARPHDFHD